ncbi:MAG TPA: MFS transporter [Candidatus Limnocylindria bacterium]|nr:MFS transporter [Candidatus Limnocylindria bacterium]
MDSTTTSARTAPATPAASVTVAADHGPALFRPLRVRDFRLVFIGETISLMGSQFHHVAIAWLTLQLTGSGLALGAVMATAAVPRAAFILLGGALSDRLSPRTLMLGSNLLRALVVAALAVLVLAGRAELWHLFVLAAIFGMVDAVFHPALGTIVPMLVSSRLLPAANALTQAMRQLSQLFGPVSAGIVVATISIGAAFVFDAASFAVAAVAIMLIRGGRRPRADGDGSAETLLANVRAGLAYAWSDPAVRSLLLLTAAFNFAFTGPVSVGLPYLAETRFDGGAVAFGLLVSAFGAGALAGAVVAGSLRRVPRLGLVVLVLAAGLGIGLAMVGNAPTLWMALPAMGGIGLGGGFLNVRVIAWLQARTPEKMLGRVMSLVLLAGVGLAPISLALAGVVIDLGAVSLLFSVAGGVMVAAVIAGLYGGVPSRMQDGETA